MMTPITSYLRKAQVLLEQRRPAEAEKQLSGALKEEPDNTQALSLLTRCKYDQRKFREGIEVILTAIKISPEEDYYYYLLGFGHYQVSENLQAQRFLEKAISLNPYASDYFGLLAMVLIEEKEFSKALSKSNEGLHLDADNITCLNARSTALNKLKRTEDAIETMQHALVQDPENDFTHTNIGWNMLEKGRHKEASQHFTEALRLNPNLDNARAGLKESLKSKIPPYRWLLQYSFWINNQGKRARWAIPLGVFLVVRLIAGATSTAGEGWAQAGIFILVLYFLFVLTSWIINPLANFLLLFNSKGKYAVTNKEKWNSVFLIMAILVAVGFFCLSLYFDTEKPNLPSFQICAVIALTLSIPLGHMEFPIRFSNNSRHQWFSLFLVASGCIALFLSLVDPNAGLVGLVVYGIGFIVYTWMNVFSSNRLN